MEQVQVLMSTYNGEKYLEDQIDSILNQVDVEVLLLIRDDGSKDRTTDILKEYARQYENIIWYQGKNIGSQRSFFELLSKADLKCKYFAFADQDDYWLSEKLVRAIEEIQKIEIEKPKQPVLYGSKVIYASEDLKQQEEFEYENKRKPEFGNALLENIFMGCTEVFNNALLELVRTNQPKQEIWHDWWLYLTSTCFGHAVYDGKAYILYRQHVNNQVGMQNSWWDRWKRRIRDFEKLKGSIRGQAQEFVEIYGKEYEFYEQVQLVAECKKIKNRLKLVTNKEIYRQQNVDNIIYRILFLFGML